MSSSGFLNKPDPSDHTELDALSPVMPPGNSDESGVLLGHAARSQLLADSDEGLSSSVSDSGEGPSDGGADLSDAPLATHSQQSDTGFQRVEIMGDYDTARAVFLGGTLRIVTIVGVLLAVVLLGCVFMHVQWLCALNPLMWLLGPLGHHVSLPAEHTPWAGRNIDGPAMLTPHTVTAPVLLTDSQVLLSGDVMGAIPLRYNWQDTFGVALPAWPRGNSSNDGTDQTQDQSLAEEPSEPSTTPPHPAHTDAGILPEEEPPYRVLGALPSKYLYFSAAKTYRGSWVDRPVEEVLLAVLKGLATCRELGLICVIPDYFISQDTPQSNFLHLVDADDQLRTLVDKARASPKKGRRSALHRDKDGDAGAYYAMFEERFAEDLQSVCPDGTQEGPKGCDKTHAVPPVPSGPTPAEPIERETPLGPDDYKHGPAFPRIPGAANMLDFRLFLPSLGYYWVTERYFLQFHHGTTDLASHLPNYGGSKHHGTLAAHLDQHDPRYTPTVHHVACLRVGLPREKDDEWYPVEFPFIKQTCGYINRVVTAREIGAVVAKHRNPGYFMLRQEEEAAAPDDDHQLDVRHRVGTTPLYHNVFSVAGVELLDVDVGLELALVRPSRAMRRTLTRVKRELGLQPGFAAVWKPGFHHASGGSPGQEEVPSFARFYRGDAAVRAQEEEGRKACMRRTELYLRRIFQLTDPSEAHTHPSEADTPNHHSDGKRSTRPNAPDAEVSGAQTDDSEVHLSETLRRSMPNFRSPFALDAFRRLIRARTVRASGADSACAVFSGNPDGLWAGGYGWRCAERVVEEVCEMPVEYVSEALSLLDEHAHSHSHTRTDTSDSSQQSTASSGQRRQGSPGQAVVFSRQRGGGLYEFTANVRGSTWNTYTQTKSLSSSLNTALSTQSRVTSVFAAPTEAWGWRDDSQQTFHQVTDLAEDVFALYAPPPLKGVFSDSPQVGGNREDTARVYYHMLPLKPRGCAGVNVDVHTGSGGASTAPSKASEPSKSSPCQTQCHLPFPVTTHSLTLLHFFLFSEAGVFLAPPADLLSIMISQRLAAPGFLRQGVEDTYFASTDPRVRQRSNAVYGPGGGVGTRPSDVTAQCYVSAALQLNRLPLLGPLQVESLPVVARQRGVRGKRAEMSTASYAVRDWALCGEPDRLTGYFGEAEGGGGNGEHGRNGASHNNPLTRPVTPPSPTHWTLWRMHKPAPGPPPPGNNKPKARSHWCDLLDVLVAERSRLAAGENVTEVVSGRAHAFPSLSDKRQGLADTYQKTMAAYHSHREICKLSVQTLMPFLVDMGGGRLTATRVPGGGSWLGSDMEEDIKPTRHHAATQSTASTHAGNPSGTTETVHDLKDTGHFSTTQSAPHTTSARRLTAIQNLASQNTPVEPFTKLLRRRKSHAKERYVRQQGSTGTFMGSSSVDGVQPTVVARGGSVWDHGLILPAGTHRMRARSLTRAVTRHVQASGRYALVGVEGGESLVNVALSVRASPPRPWTQESVRGVAGVYVPPEALVTFAYTLASFPPLVRHLYGYAVHVMNERSRLHLTGADASSAVVRGLPNWDASSMGDSARPGGRKTRMSAPPMSRELSEFLHVDIANAYLQHADPHLPPVVFYHATDRYLHAQHTQHWLQQMRRYRERVSRSKGHTPLPPVPPLPEYVCEGWDALYDTAHTMHIFSNREQGAGNVTAASVLPFPTQLSVDTRTPDTRMPPSAVAFSALPSLAVQTRGWKDPRNQTFVYQAGGSGPVGERDSAGGGVDGGHDGGAGASNNGVSTGSAAAAGSGNLGAVDNNAASTGADIADVYARLLLFQESRLSVSHPWFGWMAFYEAQGRI